MLSSLWSLLTNDMAIDLGTANSLVYVKGRGIVIDEPSVVAVDQHSGEVIAVGQDAKAMLGRAPDSIEVIRPLKDGVIEKVGMAEVLLRSLITRAQRRKAFVRPRTVVAVPSGINESEERAVRDSAENAGVREVYLISEPMAAAIGVGLPVDKPSGNMIVDIGGGTTDVAVIALSGTVAKTSIKVGGDGMNEAVAQHVKKKYNLLVGIQVAEQIKMAIGSAHPEEGEDDDGLEVKGRDLVEGIPKTIRIKTSEIRIALRDPVEEIVRAVKRTLEETPPELAADIVDRGIVMTGGGALLRGLDVFLRERTNLPINVVEDPLTCVVLGAGKVLDETDRYEKVLLKSHRR
ncbi:MAG: rod shape-determining protein [Gemmatimonadota bacterium]|jgi:rod shape-determining protein MreB|nr:rod shape-determining protein [Gemmatimonadota bacterium]MDP6528144.1 rod shape-determining protein [Gemmatimonadota bacterium]MDP6801754.1 rod shape-determining protein [Gemmatimonadota bacterium]MDP7031170.1 rod shape-determining protein [Gemmatimonadota bacterium]